MERAAVGVEVGQGALVRGDESEARGDSGRAAAADASTSAAGSPLRRRPAARLVQVCRGAYASDGLEHVPIVAVVVEQLLPSDVDLAQLGTPPSCGHFGHAAPPKSFHAERMCAAFTASPRV